MAPPPIAPVDRYIHPETTRVYWVESIGDIQSPTRLELDAGVDLTGEVADLSGWDLHSLTFTDPSLGEDFESQRFGPLAASASSIALYADRTGSDIRELLGRDTAGFITILEGGDVTGRPMSVWPVTVAATPRGVAVDSEPARISIQFVITSEPAQDVEVP